MISKVKLIFYAVVVFSIYLYAIYYSFGDNETNLFNPTTKQIAHSSDESNINKGINIKLILRDSSGNPLGETDLIIKNNKERGNEKDKHLLIHTNNEGETRLDIMPGKYLIYIENNRTVQKPITVDKKDDDRDILVKF